MKYLLVLALAFLTSSAYADGQLITRFGLRCTGPFKTVNTGVVAHGVPSSFSVGQNYQSAGVDMAFNNVASLGDGTVTVSFKPKVVLGSLAVSVEQGADSVQIKSFSPNTVTLILGSCEMNSVVVLHITGTLQ